MSAAPPRSKIKRALTWLKFNWPALVTLIGTLAIAYGGIGSFVAPTEQLSFILSLVGGVITTAVGGVAGMILQPSIAKTLEAAAAATAQSLTLKQGVRAIFAAELAEMQRAIERYSDGCRASVYLNEGERFVILARSSSDPNLRRYGRTTYPADQGVIGKAWSGRRAVAAQLPAGRDLWNERMQRDFNIPVEVASKISMQSRSLIALRVDHEGPGGHRPLGVVVLESTAPTAMGSAEMDAVTRSREWPMLCGAIIAGIEALLATSSDSDADMSPVSG